MKFLIDRCSNVLVATVLLISTCVLSSSCGGEACNLVRLNNQFSVDFTEPVPTYSGTFETGDVWLRSARKYNLRGDETNAIVFLAEHVVPVSVDVACADGVLVSGGDFFHPDCSEALRWADGSFIPMHFSVQLESEAGSVRFPDDGKVSFETYEELEGSGSCFGAREVGSVTIDTSGL